MGNNITPQLYLPDHLIISIFEHLPVKSVIRFRSVSKSLGSLIYNSSFISCHLKQSSISYPNYERPNVLCIVSMRSNLTRLMFYNETTESLYARYDFSNNDIFSNVLGYCNGVICFLELGFQSFYFWNPLVNKYVKQTIEYHSFSSSICVGFGYDPSNNHFKFLHVSYSKGAYCKNEINPIVAKLYTINGSGNVNTWRIYSITPPQIHGSCVDKFSSVYVNGCLHWLVNYYSNVSFSRHILSFNMKDEAFQELALPDQYYLNSSKRVNVTEFKGMLCVLPCWFDDSCDIPYTIWVMREYGKVESWTPLCEIRLRTPELFRVVGLKNNGEELWCFKGCNSRVHVLNQKSLKVRRCKRILAGHHSLFQGTYTESLALMDAEDGK